VLSRSVNLLDQPVQLLADARRRLFGAKDWSFVCAAGLFAQAVRVDLGESLRALGDAKQVTVDIEVDVARGEVGSGLVNRSGDYLPGAEAIVSPGNRLVTLNAAAGEMPAALVFQNVRAGVRGAFAVRSAALRVAV
jgi:hypothetical protein